MESLIDLTQIHAPPGGDPRAHGRRLKEIGKYVALGAAIAAAIGFYFYYFESRGYIEKFRWAVVCGICVVLVVGNLIGLLKLQKELSLVLWIVGIISGLVIHAGGIRDSELGALFLSISGTMLIISVTVTIKGNILLKTYM